MRFEKAKFLVFIISTLIIQNIYAQNNVRKLERATEIIQTIENDDNQKELSKLNNFKTCHLQNEIIRKNNQGILALTEGRYLLAKSYFSIAIELERELNSSLDESLLEFNYSIANLYPNKRFCFTKIDSAQQHLLSIPKKHDKYGLNYYLGMAEFYKGNYKAAQSYFSEDFKITTDPRSILAEVYSYYLMGDYQNAYIGYKNHKSAINTFANQEIYYNEIIGNICSKAGEHSEAIEAFKKINPKYWKSDDKSCKHFATNSDLKPFLREPLGKRDNDCSQKYMTAKYDDILEINLAFENLSLNNFKKTEKIVEDFKSSNALDYTKNYLKAICAYKDAINTLHLSGKKEKFSYAKQLFIDVIKNSNDLLGNNTDENIYIGLAFSSFYCGELAQCRDYILRAKRSNPNNPKTLEANSILNFVERRDEDAINEIKKIIDIDPSYDFSYDATVSVAYYYYLHGEINEFSIWFEKLKVKYSDFGGYYALEGLLHHNVAIQTESSQQANSESNIAKEYYEKALSKEPLETTFYSNYANLLFDMLYGNNSYLFSASKDINFQKIVDNYNKAISLDSENTYAYNGKSMCYYQEWQKDKTKTIFLDSAIDFVDKAISTHNKLNNDIDYYRNSLTSLYLNKQWLLLNKAENSNKDSIGQNMEKAWAAAENGIKLIPSAINVFRINQAVGWAHLNDETKMKELHDTCLVSSSEDMVAVILNNKGVFYHKNNNSVASEEHFNQGLTFAKYHVTKNTLNVNLKNIDPKFEIYYYKPVTDFRPRNIELNIDFEQPYFNPQLDFELSSMETFSFDNIIKEECPEKHEIKEKKEMGYFEEKQISKKVEDTWIHCPSEKKLLSKIFKR